MGGLGSCVEAPSPSALSLLLASSPEVMLVCVAPKAQRSGTQTGYKRAKSIKIVFCVSPLISSLSIRRLSVYMLVVQE